LEKQLRPRGEEPPKFPKFDARTAERKPAPKRDKTDPDTRRIVEAVEGNINVFMELSELYGNVANEPDNIDHVVAYAKALDKVVERGDKNELMGIIGSGVTAMYMFQRMLKGEL
jgi:hypothetical protein